MIDPVDVQKLYNDLGKARDRIKCLEDVLRSVVNWAEPYNNSTEADVERANVLLQEASR